MVVQLPGERIVERYFQPVERQTEPLPTVPPVINIEVPATPPVAASSHIVINVPERSKDENEGIRGTDKTNNGAPYPETERGSASAPEVPPVVEEPVQEVGPTKSEQKPVDKNVPPTNKKRSEINSPNNSPTIPEHFQKELFEPDKPAPQDGSEEFEKIGPGRQRRYEELGEKEVEPVRELILFRNEFGRHWPGLSRDMEQYYEYFYFTPPNKRKDGKNYARHVKCWERRTKWLSSTQPTPDSK